MSKYARMKFTSESESSKTFTTKAKIITYMNRASVHIHHIFIVKNWLYSNISTKI